MNDPKTCSHRNVVRCGGCAAYDLETGEQQYNCKDCGYAVTDSEIREARYVADKETR